MMRKILLAATVTLVSVVLAAPSAFAWPLSERCDGVTGGCLTDPTTPEESPKKKGKG